MVATISSLVMLVMHVIGYDQTEYFGISLPGAPAAARVPYDGSAIGLWLDLVVYVFAFYLTAFISGYWSFKFRRMLDFQRSLLNYLNSGFLIVDKDGFIRTFNDAAQSMLGYSLPAAMNRPVNEIMRTVDGSDNPVEQTLRTGAELTSHEFTGRRHDGSPLPLGITTSVIRDRFDRTEGVIASFADMTDLDRVRRELRRQDRLAAVGRLAAGLAHEIRNPVASIRGAIEELKNSMDDPVTMQTLADIAIRESDQLNAIVTGFLDYARGAPRDIGPLDLRDALEEVIVLLRRDEDSNHNIELTVEQEDNLVVDGDHSQLKQAFMNIGKNAMEAMLDGGTLSVVAENDADRTVTVTFSDTGEGMNDEDLSTVFEPFFTTKPHGVGMGLAVVHRIVTSHNGTVLIDSTPGKGTSVRMTFPSHSVDDIRLQTEFCGEVNQNATPASSRS
jgi:PAS domain S-box-containing protein